MLYERVEAEAVSAPGGGRLYAYGGIAVYEAVRPGISGALSLSGQLTNMPAMPTPDSTQEYDWAASVTGTMAVVLTGILPTTPDTTKAITDLRTKQVAARKETVDAEIVDRSLAYGESVGKQIVDWANADNARESHAKAKDYVVPANIPSDWVVTTPGRPPVEPYWGSVRPFGLPSSDICNVPLDMEFSTDPASTFYAQANEVKTVGEKLTDEQKAIAQFWVDTPGETGTPAGHWVSITAQLIKQTGRKLDKAAEALAMVGIAVGDAFIACWDLKYKIMLMRPETFIQKYIRRSWRPYIQTPIFPEYVSGHSVVSETAAQVLTSIFGTIAFKDSTHQIYNHNDPPRPPRSFTSLEAAAQEAAISRLYGGIHFRVGIENGLKQGRCLAATILSRVHLHAQ
ncbi:MAG: vanadium-dependent haloperoxidase [Anaerolineae bacterium]|nr:vanadium-dependent haloperoxidase [Anaerolineae bacterium]